jgi:hypothetical protein
MDSACALRGHNTLNESIAESLMIPFKMAMLHVLGEHPSEMALAKWDHAMQTLFFDGAHESLRVGIRIRRLKRGLRDADARVTLATFPSSAARRNTRSRQAVNRTCSAFVIAAPLQAQQPTEES